MVVCCVKGCRHGISSSERTGISFFRFPVVNDKTDDSFRKLICDRRSVWLQRINRVSVYKEARVCSEHFISGKPAAVTDTGEVDWAPSCKLPAPATVGSTANNCSLTAGAGDKSDVVTKKRRRSPVCTGTSMCDATTQCDMPTTATATTQCCIQCCKVNQETQCDRTDQPVLKSAGVNCRLLVAPRVPVDVSSPSAATVSTGSQVISSQDSDLSYRPTQSDESQFEEESSSQPTHCGKKFLVYKECLSELLQLCPLCTQACELNWHGIGTYVSVTRMCTNCEHKNIWGSQPMIGNMPAGNISLSAAIYFTGGSFSKVNKFLTALQVETISPTTFYNHARRFLQPSILTLWRSTQSDLLHEITQRSGDVVLGGDMRADSPGHCAKYGSYTVLELRCNRIVDVQLVQSNEVNGSSHMEKEGLVRSMAFLQARGLSVDTIITDRHPQIQKYLREEMPSVKHYYDVWHVAKGLTKKLEALGNQRGCQDIRAWIKSIVNHLYWSAASSESGEEAVAKWLSVINHVQNVHVHDSWLFPECLHGELDKTNETKNWLQPSTAACGKLETLLRTKRLLTDVLKLSPHHQTSSIEAYHSLILQFAPKSIIYSYKGMLCRLVLAAIHFNENADRCQLVDTSGNPIYRIRFPKFKKGGFSITPVKSPPTSDYIKKLMQLLFSTILPDPERYLELHGDITIPPPLCSKFVRPTESDIKLSSSRFNQKL